MRSSMKNPVPITVNNMSNKILNGKSESVFARKYALALYHLFWYSAIIMRKSDGNCINVGIIDEKSRKSIDRKTNDTF